MAYEDIYKRYKSLFNSQNNGLNQKRNATVQSYNNAKNTARNQYSDINTALNAKMSKTKAQYAVSQKSQLAQYNNLYAGLDKQNVAAKATNYSDRNAVDTGVNQNLNRVQELMAKNGWSGGGENLQAQLNSNSDRQNGFGGADKTMNTTLANVLTARNTDQANQATDGNALTSEFQNNSSDITNQTNQNTRDGYAKARELQDAINSTNTGYYADSNALKSGLDAQAGAEIAQVQAVERQHAYEQAQVAKQHAYEQQQQAQARAYAAQQQRATVQRQAVARVSAARKKTASRSSGGKVTSGANGGISDINNIVGLKGKYAGMSYEKRIGMLQDAANNYNTQVGANAKYLLSYANQAISKLAGEVKQVSVFTQGNKYLKPNFYQSNRGGVSWGNLKNASKLDTAYQNMINR